MNASSIFFSKRLRIPAHESTPHAMFIVASQLNDHTNAPTHRMAVDSSARDVIRHDLSIWLWVIIVSLHAS